MNPAISIIVPVYNTAMYLPRCIESILAQTFADFELILVDDGSSDHCGQICDEYAQRDRRIRVIHQKNSGVSAARNAALEIATGTYIMFCDSDDWVDPDWCRCLYQGIQRENVVMTVCGYRHVDHGGTVACHNTPENGDIGMNEFLYLWEHYLINMLWNKIYLSSLIKNSGLKFLENVSLGEDIRFTLQYLSSAPQGGRIVNCACTTYNYAKTEGSLTNIYRADFWQNQCDELAVLEDASRQLGADLTQYEQFYNNRCYHVINLELRNIFSPNAPWEYWEKYKKVKTIVNSPLFPKMLKASWLKTPPKWYLFILKHRLTFFLYLYYVIKSR